MKSYTPCQQLLELLCVLCLREKIVKEEDPIHGLPCREDQVQEDQGEERETRKEEDEGSEQVGKKRTRKPVS